jgi:hypothetical protein
MAVNGGKTPRVQAVAAKAKPRKVQKKPKAKKPKKAAQMRSHGANETAS